MTAQFTFWLLLIKQRWVLRAEPALLLVQVWRGGWQWRGHLGGSEEMVRGGRACTWLRDVPTGRILAQWGVRRESRASMAPPLGAWTI